MKIHKRNQLTNVKLNLQSSRRQQMRKLVLMMIGTVVGLIVISLSASGVTVAMTPYDSLTRLSAADTTKAEGTLRQFVSRLSETDLLSTLREASSREDSALVFRHLGLELIQRLKHSKQHLAPIVTALELNTAGESYFRYVLLWAIANASESFSSDQSNYVFQAARKLTDPDRSKSIRERLAAIIVSNATLEMMVSGDSVQPSTVEDYGAYLQEIATSKTEDSEIRRAAIKGISEIQFREAVPSLLNLLHSTGSQEVPSVLRSLCIALARLEVREAIPDLRRILETTPDKYVFGSAAIALSRLGTIDALSALVANPDRFDCGFISTAVQQMDTLIGRLLVSRDNDSLKYGIQAMEYLYDDVQVERCKSVLMELLRVTNDVALKRTILDQLMRRVTRDEAKKVIQLVPFDKEYSSQWNWLNGLAKSVQAPAIMRDVASDEATSVFRITGGNGWEYGDPGYRANGWYLVSERGHAGLMAGVNAGNNQRILEIGKTNGSVGVQDNAWSDMVDDAEFWGVFTLNNFGMTFNKRRNVMATAVALTAYDIGYPVVPTPDMLRYHSSPGAVIDPWNVSDLRCDGLVEYCYEYNGLSVWGKNNAHYDVSNPDWVGEHNDFYDWPWNSCEETAPDVQCGRSTDGGLCSYMTAWVYRDLPTYSTSWIADCSAVDIYVTATDQSGIHYIRARRSNDATYTTSAVQPQHPNSTSFTAHFRFTLTTPGWIYFYAKDGAGNYPITVPGIYVSPLSYSTCCCVGRSGNVDCDNSDGVDISDLATLIDYLYITFTSLCCPEEADVDGTAGIDISDLSALIDYLYISFTPPELCGGGNDSTLVQ